MFRGKVIEGLSKSHDTRQPNTIEHRLYFVGLGHVPF